MTFVVPGKPSAWQRAQKFGKRHFTLPKMEAAQAAIAGRASAAMREPLGPDYDGPVFLDVVAFFEIPKTRQKGRNRLAVGDRHLQKPDGSNVGKQVEDALNGVAYHDDAQVCDTRCRKFWGERNETVITLCTGDPE